MNEEGETSTKIYLDHLFEFPIFYSRMQKSKYTSFYLGGEGCFTTLLGRLADEINIQCHQRLGEVNGLVYLEEGLL